jgi:hypothetical protein
MMINSSLKNSIKWTKSYQLTNFRIHLHLLKSEIVMTSVVDLDPHQTER